MYKNIDEIKEEFGIETDNYDEIISELRKLQKNIHPDITNKDHNGFKTIEDELLFEKIEKAKTFIRSDTKTMQNLININEVAPIIKAVKEMVETSNKSIIKTNCEEKLNNYISENIDEMHKINRVPKVTSAIISTLLTFVFLFPNQVENHPILGSIIEVTSQKFIRIWILSVLFTINLWILLTIKELQNEHILKTIRNTQFQNRIFRKCVDKYKLDRISKPDLLHYFINFGISEKYIFNNNWNSLRYRHRSPLLNQVLKIYSIAILFLPVYAQIYFSKGDFSIFSLEFILLSLFLYTLTDFIILKVGILDYNIIDMEVAESVVDITISRLIERGILEKYEGKAFEEEYIINYN